jgi:SAM-dependent methyltransferase
MTEQEVRYDEIAEGYAAWWSVVHRGATLELLDEIAPDVEAGARRIVDVGCGTGALAAAAVERWDGVEIDAVDASDGMLRVADRELAALSRARRRRVRLAHAYADALPVVDGRADVVVSSFVYQLVPSRIRALREALRVLRPGGRLAYVTWLQGGEPWAADDAFDDALEAAGLEPRDYGDERPGDVASPRAAVDQLRRAGFERPRAREAQIDHAFTPEGYLGFLAEFDEQDRFASLDPDVRASLVSDLLARLRALPPDGLRLVLPIVYASGRRPAEPRPG